MAISKSRAVYMIGVAAKLVGMHPQTLRLYEREELIIPQRTAKDTRLYSESDIELLKEIQAMTQDLGLNLAGVKMILEMKKNLAEREDSYIKIKNRAESEIMNANNELELMREKMEDEIEKVKKSLKHDIMLYKKASIRKVGSDT